MRSTQDVPEVTRPYIWAVNTAANVTTVGARLVGGNVYNPGAAVAYLQIHDAEAGAQSTETIVFTQALPPTMDTILDIPRPIRCSTQMSIFVATTRTGGTVAPTVTNGELRYW